MTATQSSSQQQRAKKYRSVSKKFYESIKEQVWSVHQLHDDLDAERLMRYVDAFIDHSLELPKGLTSVELAVFVVLRPLIFKAMSRTAKAREAALHRSALRELAREEAAKAASQPEEASTQTSADTPTDTKTDTQADIPTVTEEMKREARRDAISQRRMEKHLKRMARRKCNGA